MKKLTDDAVAFKHCLDESKKPAESADEHTGSSGEHTEFADDEDKLKNAAAVADKLKNAAAAAAAHKKKCDQLDIDYHRSLMTYGSFVENNGYVVSALALQTGSGQNLTEFLKFRFC